MGQVICHRPEAVVAWLEATNYLEALHRLKNDEQPTENSRWKQSASTMENGFLKPESKTAKFPPIPTLSS